jgi:sterol desaturase/sphingolipid hydroxylase (fatty acid hydroxylase superfamily)
MHRVHHSIDGAEALRNYGFALSWWDRLGGTYQAQPATGHQAMTLGIPDFRDPGDARIARLLLQPFRTPRAAALRPREAIAAGESPRP